MANRLGQQLGNYRLISLLGQGSFADVYLGEHIHLNTQAAIKVLRTQLASDDIEKFRTEARIIARLVHPHIVRVLEFGVQDQTPFLVLDYAPQGTLHQLHPKGVTLPLTTIVSYVNQVADALQYAHNAQVIHRDIKPRNMLVGRNNEILLSDFGIALVAKGTQGTNSLSTQEMGSIQEMVGTMAYMAPEQLQGNPQPASDQYALAIVVYEWLSGDRPFHGAFPEIAVKHTLIPPPPLHEKLPTILLAVEDVVLRALAKDPHQRYANVRAFADALGQASLSEPYLSSAQRTLLVLPSGQPAEPRHASDLVKVQTRNLPAQLTSLIGREQEEAAACTLLRRQEVRLLTLTGTGGVGKTRLGLQVATDLLDDFADGVCFVSLAPISDPDLVIPTIAQTLGLWEIRDRALLEHLKASLRDKYLLLLLDNFEQVMMAAPLLTELLAACPQLKILVTSRAVLHVRGEHEFPVSPLALPDLAHLPKSEVLPQYTAVALFLQRARAVKPDFQVTAANARTIAEICVHLDGLPLAIELAAARSKLLPPQALLSRLKHRLQVLTSEARDVPTRQQTLRNAILWSYNLLDAEEQRLFRRLSVFVGGCTLQTVEAVCAALDNGAAQVLDRVASLIDKSLLQQTEQENEEPRLVMLETIREYGRECLVASGEAEVTQHAHANYYMALAEEGEPKLRSAQQAVWLERLDREHENLRAALSWLVEQAGVEQAELALRLSGALYWFWSVRGHYNEGRRWLERALAGSSEVTVAVRAKALYAAGMLALYQGDYSRAAALFGESLTLFREQGDKRHIAALINGVAFGAFVRGDYAAAHAGYDESLALFRELKDQRGIADTLYAAALVPLLQGDYAAARIMAEEGLALFRELREQRGIADSLSILGRISFGQGHPAEARLLMEESLALFRVVGDRRGIAYGLGTLGQSALYQGDFAAARSMLEESLAILMKSGDKWLIAIFLTELAGAVAAQGQPMGAARLWGAMETLREEIGAPIAPILRAIHEHMVTTARAQLDEETFAAAWAEGRTMTPEQAIAAQKPVTMSTLISVVQPSTTAIPPPIYPAGLTRREVEVLRLIAQGLTDAQVAQQLVISPRTVNTHLTAIYSKIQVSSRSAATRYAIEQHLV